MPIYEFKQEGVRLLPATTFGAANLHERRDLQRLLRERIEVVAADALVIAEEAPPATRIVRPVFRAGSYSYGRNAYGDGLPSRTENRRKSLTTRIPVFSASSQGLLICQQICSLAICRIVWP